MQVTFDTINQQANCASTSVAKNAEELAAFQRMAHVYGKPLLEDGKGGNFFISDGWLFLFYPAK